MALFLGMLVGTWFWGAYSDYTGRRFSFMATIVIDSVFALASAFAPLDFPQAQAAVAVQRGQVAAVGREGDVAGIVGLPAQAAQRLAGRRVDDGDGDLAWRA